MITERHIADETGSPWVIVYSASHRKELEDVVQALDERGLSPRTIDRDDEPLAWVAVPPPESEAALAALRRRERLARRLARREGRAFASGFMSVVLLLIVVFGGLAATGWLGLFLVLPIAMAAAGFMRRANARWGPPRAKVPPGIRSGVACSAGPAGFDDLVPVYRALYGGNTNTALRRLREAGCDPVPLDEPFPLPALPYLSPTYEVRIAVPAAQLGEAREALLAWINENADRLAQFKKQMRAWLLAAAALTALALIIFAAARVLTTWAVPELSGLVFWVTVAWGVGLLVALACIQRGIGHAGRRRTWFVALFGFFALMGGVFLLRGDTALRPVPFDQRPRSGDRTAPG